VNSFDMRNTIHAIELLVYDPHVCHTYMTNLLLSAYIKLYDKQ